MLKVLVLVLLLASPALAYTDRGVASSEDAARRALVQWKSRISEYTETGRKLRAHNITYGAYFQCRLPGGKVKWAYSYGESSPSVARETAALAFDSAPGDCPSPPACVELSSRDDLLSH
jgi:hypothetical protein